jgi:hypothetical protein
MPYSLCFVCSTRMILWIHWIYRNYFHNGICVMCFSHEATVAGIVVGILVTMGIIVAAGICIVIFCCKSKSSGNRLVSHSDGDVSPTTTTTTTTTVFVSSCSSSKYPQRRHWYPTQSSKILYPPTLKNLRLRPKSSVDSKILPNE